MAIATNNAIANRYEFVLLFDVTNGNPNGDPDAGNQPRIDAETGHGLVTDVCLKRKIRDFVSLAKTDHGSGTVEDGYRIYVEHRGILERFHREAYEVNGLKGNEKDKQKKRQNVATTQDWMCKTFFDIRTFGAVLSLKGSDTGEGASSFNCGQVRGPAQLNFARSIDPIMQDEFSIVRKAVAKQSEADEQIGRSGEVTGTMGNKHFVPYALYRAHGFISPHLAADTGFSEADLELLWQALTMMFEHDRSAARGQMSTQKLIVFKHENALGNAPAHKLFDRVTVTLNDSGKPPRAFSDYTVAVNTEKLPNGISVEEKV
jgi:CRISPR-associated protein Csd2